jgi:heme/copper-type cytochrome/quinol oxidase subunit 2
MTLTAALYLTDILTSVKEVIVVLAIVGVVVILFASILFFSVESTDSDADQQMNSCMRIIKKWPYVALLVMLIVILPSKKTMYLMLGATYLQDSNLPTKVSKALELKLDDYIKELSGNNKNE